ncbi:MAG: hypothetical protein PHU72_05030 [Dethiosulfovibrio sp.]|nr:hypothetical protein [Dethiosulfovibrio sp.]
MPLFRTLHDIERRYLNMEAQTMVYRYLACVDVPREVVEKAIDEAISFGRSQRKPVDAEIFSALVDTFFLDKYYGPELALRHSDNYPTWIC